MLKIIRIKKYYSIKATAEYQRAGSSIFTQHDNYLACGIHQFFYRVILWLA
jgi:hypothetical protein